MRAYILITGVIFAIVALVHLLRLLLDWPAQVAGLAVPPWASWIAFLVAAALAIWAFSLVAGDRRGGANERSRRECSFHVCGARFPLSQSPKRALPTFSFVHATGWRQLGSKRA